MASLLSLNKSYVKSGTLPYAPFGGDSGGNQLTNGVTHSGADGSYESYWVFYYGGTNPITVIDLGAQYALNHVRFFYMTYAAAAVSSPSQVVISGSNDNVNFTTLGTFNQSGNWNTADNKWAGAWSNDLSVSGTYQYIKFSFTISGNGTTISELDVWGDPASNIKTINGLAKSSIKTINGLAIANVKTFNGLA